MASPVIELQNVTLSFGEHVLLEHISVKVFKGQALVLIGPSGHGKSCVLKLMSGLLEPSSGTLFIKGLNPRAMRSSERECLARSMGMLFQKNALFDSLTVAENVAFPLREVIGASEKEIRQAIDFYLDAVGLSHARDLFPDEISGGMQKRLGIARALALKPEIVFYDDPTAGLDPITSRKIIQLIKNLQESSNTTLVAVTNDINRAVQLADHMAMIVDGELLHLGVPAKAHEFPDPRVQQFIRGELSGPLTVAS